MDEEKSIAFNSILINYFWIVFFLFNFTYGCSSNKKSTKRSLGRRNSQRRRKRRSRRRRINWKIDVKNCILREKQRELKRKKWVMLLMTPIMILSVMTIMIRRRRNIMLTPTTKAVEKNVRDEGINKVMNE